MTWTTLRLRVATPLFNDSAGGRAGVWVPSIRGAMRFWFRALVGAVIGPDLDGLHRVEARVFGSTEQSSPVRLRIPEILTPAAHAWPGWLNGHQAQWIGYLLGQGLYHPHRGLRRRYIDVGAEFDLLVRLPDEEEVAAGALAALWLTCTYGGIGARVRRGFGGVRIVGVDGDLPQPWTAETIVTPGIERYANIARLWPGDPVLGRCMSHLVAMARAAGVSVSADPWGDRPPTYPVFSRRYTAAALAPDDGTWTTILARAGEDLRHFRASQDYPDAGYHPPIKTPEWESVIHGDSDHFALGALGLPIGYQHGFFVHADRGASHQAEKLRRASPLWLRVVGDGNRCRLLSFAFQGEFLPDGVGVHVWHHGQQRKNVTVKQDDVVTLTERWIEAMRTGEAPDRT